MQLWRSSHWQSPCHRRRCAHGSARRVAAAAKGKASGKGKSVLPKKKVEKDADPQEAPQPHRSPEVRSLLLFMATSYYKHTRKYLMEADFEALPDAVFNAPFALLAHDRFQEGVEDPQFIYANRAALELFEASWDELIGMPSRKSVAEADQVKETEMRVQERQELLDAAAKAGVVTNYEGWRQGLKGKRFKIKGVTLFNIEDASGDKIGQAALFDKYELNGKEVEVQAYRDAMAALQAAPTAEQVEEAQQSVQKWAEYVRALKEVHGLGNKDPQVQEAVTSLQAWKAQLASLQERLDQAMAAAKAGFDEADKAE